VALRKKNAHPLTIHIGGLPPANTTGWYSNPKATSKLIAKLCSLRLVEPTDDDDVRSSRAVEVVVEQAGDACLDAQQDAVGQRRLWFGQDAVDDLRGAAAEPVQRGPASGNWGVMSVFPTYQNARDLFGKSAHPYRYHNCADWPYWDGVYGLILRREGDPDWRYVLTRW